MLTGCPRVYHLAIPRAVTMTPRVAMNGGMDVQAISVPLRRPAAAPTASPATTGTTTGKSVSAGYTALTASDDCARLAATIAGAATTEPDDRSMPREMITWVTPTAMMPITETCRIITTRRCWFRRKLCPTKIHPSSSKASASPTSTSRMLASGGNLRARVAEPAGTVRCAMCLARGEVPALYFIRLLALKDSRDAPLVHHHDAMAHAENLRHLRGDHQDSHALGDQTRNQLVDLGLGADVDPARWLIENQNLRTAEQPAAEQHLLLIA